MPLQVEIVPDVPGGPKALRCNGSKLQCCFFWNSDISSPQQAVKVPLYILKIQVAFLLSISKTAAGKISLCFWLQWPVMYKWKNTFCIWKFYATLNKIQSSPLVDLMIHFGLPMITFISSVPSASFIFPSSLHFLTHSLCWRWYAHMIRLTRELLRV